jgi:transcription elongation factor Elf1
MSTDAFMQQIRSSIMENARERIKQDFKEKVPSIPCKNCNLPSYALENFSDSDNLVVAHLKCTNCGLTGSFNIRLCTDGVDEGLKSVKTGLDGLQKTIEDANRKFN